MSRDTASGIRVTRVTVASALGLCFGVERAIRMAKDEAGRGPLTIIGELVHNPHISRDLAALGVAMADRDRLDQITTPTAMISAHGAADSLKQQLRARSLRVIDATCPLVENLHQLARRLETEGFFPVVIGSPTHVEVQGVVGNLRECLVISSVDDLERLRGRQRIGVVSQTTKQPREVALLVAAIRRLPWVTEVSQRATICKPVRDRQAAVAELLRRDITLGVVVGGYKSNNTKELTRMLSGCGIPAIQVEDASQLPVDPTWPVVPESGGLHLGFTAGTSTPMAKIQEVFGAVLVRLGVDAALMLGEVIVSDRQGRERQQAEQGRTDDWSALRQACADRGIAAYRLDRRADLRREWLATAHHVAVIAGTITPAEDATALVGEVGRLGDAPCPVGDR